MVNNQVVNKYNYFDRSTAKMWRAGLYLRISREDGDKYESDSISSQREMLLDFIRRNPDISVFKIYEDDGFSGTNFNRPGFIEMEDALRAKQIDCIIVKDLSRFARNCIEIGNYLSVLFPYLKTRFICINDHVDSYLDPASLDNLNTKFKNLINDEYCRDISEKVKSSLTVSRKNGDYIGSFGCYGYFKDPVNRHHLIIDEVAAENVRTIYKKFISGESMRRIVSYLNSNGVPCPAKYKKEMFPTYNNAFASDKKIFWSERTVARILKNRMYVGDMVQHVMEIVSYRFQKCRSVNPQDYIIVNNTHEAIISREDFEMAQTILARDTRESPKTQELNVLAGFIKCGDCRHGMYKKKYISGKKTYIYYYCSTFKNRGKDLCTRHCIQAKVVENVILKFIQFHVALVLEIEPIIELINSSPERINRIQKYDLLLEKYDNERKKILSLQIDLYPDYKQGLINLNEYEIIRSQYQEKLNTIEKQIDDVNKKINELNSGILSENKFIRNFKKYKNISELTREVVIALINNIYIYENQRIEIEMKYRDEYELALDFVTVNKNLLLKLKDIQTKNLKKVIDKI